MYVSRAYVEELKGSLEDAENKLTESNSCLAEKSKQYEAALQSVEQLEHKLEPTEEALQEFKNATLQKEKECEGIYESDKVSEFSAEILCNKDCEEYSCFPFSLDCQ